MPLTPEERARRRESRRSDREKERKTGANSLRNNLQGYQTESARLFGLSVLSSNDSSNISSSILRNSSNESRNNLDSSFNSAAKQGRRIIHRNLSGIEEGLDSSAAEDIKSGSLHSMHMQPPGQDAAQGASPRHNRAGPFDKDNSEDDDNYYDEEEGETNNNGNPFLDDSVDDRASSPEEREFQPAKLDRSGRSGKSNKSGRTSEGGPGGSFDADDDAPSKARPANLVASALTTSSAATQKVANTDVDGSNRKTARDRFMDVMPDDEEDRGETVEDYGSPFNNTGPSPFDDDSVDDQASQGSYEQPRAYRPFSGGSQSSVATGDVSGEHYASMQELLEEERSRSIVGHKTSRCGGCVEKVLGGKRTKRRKITLLVIIVLLCVMIGVSVWSIVLGPKGTRGSGDGKGGGVETQNNLNKPIERPATSFTPAKSENSSSSADSTFGMDNNSTDDLLGFELTFPLEGVTTDATSDSTSPTSSPVAAPTLVSPEMIIPAEIETTPTPSGSPTPPISEFNLPEPVSATNPPTEFPTAAEMTVEPTESPTAAETTLQPTDAPLAAPFVSPTSDPTTAAPVSNPTNPPITTSVPSVQTDISGLLTFSEPVPQDTEADLIIFLDALKKSIRSAVSSSLQPSDELVYVEIISINGEPVNSLLSRRRFIRRRLQFGTLIEYELVVLSDCDSPDCANADTIASDVVSRTTDEMSSSVDSGAFASTLEVNVLSSSGGSVEFLSGVELGYFSEPKVTVLTPTLDYGANETSSINSTSPVDIIAANETEPIDSSTADNNTATFDTCNFCEDGMPDPLKVVSTNGLTCNQLKEAVSEEDSESSTCMTVQQAEVLCCATSATASDTSSETFSMNETMVSDEADVDIGEGNATFTGNETIVTNSTNGELGDINITDTSSMNTTEWGNETFSTNITSGHYLSEHNETTASNFTYDFNIIMDTVGNETFVSYGDGQITDKNGTDSEFDLIDRNETMAINSTSEDINFDIIDTTDGNETSLSFDAMPIMYDNGTDSGFVNDALWPDLVCPDTLSRSIEVDVYASLFYEVVRPSSLEARNGILCARLEVKSLGWVGFALSRDGAMIGSEAIIALPSDNTVLKYSLLGKSSDLISKVDDDHQTLRDTSVTQDLELGITTMEFVKHLEEFEEIPILTSGPNYFLYARGWSNVLGYHQGRMSFMKDFAEDVVAVVDDDVSVDPSDSNETLVTNFTSDTDDASTPSNVTEVEEDDYDVDGTNSTASASDPPVSICNFCNNGMPEPFKVVSDSGLTCNQLKEAVADKESDSNTCIAVKQGEGLCCELSSTVSDTITETSSTHSTMDSNETIATNFTSEDSVDNTVSSPMNSTLIDNETAVITNSTSCEFCADGMPDPLKVVTSNGLNCNQLKEMIFEEESDSGTCMQVMQAEGLCCSASTTASDEIDETVSTNSTVDRNETITTNSTSEDSTNETTGMTDSISLCKFCADGMPDPLKVVTSNGLNCNQLKEMIFEEESDSGTCMQVMQAEGLCCSASTTASDEIDETVSTNSTVDSKETITTNSTSEDSTNETTGMTDSISLCKFCADGMPDPLKVVTSNGLNCNQLKEMIFEEESDSGTCMQVMQAEGLCCSASTTASDEIDETVSTNSTVDSNETITTNSTSEDSTNETTGMTDSISLCKFCADGMPDPLKVVTSNGLNCNQLKEMIFEEESDSGTCMQVMQAEGLCCATLTTSSDTTLVGNETTTATNSTPAVEGTEVGNATDYDDTPITDLMNPEPFINSTLPGNETSNSTSEDYDFNIIMDTVGNETFVSYGDGQITDKNGTDSEFDLIDRNETMAINSTSEDINFDIIDTTDGNETSLSFDAMPIMYDNGTDSGFVNDALWPDLVCPDTLSRSIEVDVYASLFYEVVRPSSLEARNGILCARLEVKSLGWVGFALSRDGAMIGSEAIIALPSDNTVLKYSLLGKSSDLISKVDDDHQTLRDTSVTQDLELGITTMEFVKHLEEFEEIPILTSGPNYFLYARGWSNVLGYHQGRMSFMKDFAEDVVAVVDDDVSVDPSDSNETFSSNFTLDGSDFNTGTVVVGDETFVTFEDMPVIYANGTDSGLDNDALYPDDNSTLDDNDGAQTFNNVVTASDNTSDPGVLNSTLEDSNGSLVDVIDVPDPSAILDALSLPYTLSHELGGISAAAHFGFSVAMSSSGNIVAVGAKDMAEPVLREEVGAVHLYSMETSPPKLLQTVFNEYPKGEFGNSIGLSNDGSRLVVGARSENDQAGVVRVYGRDSFGQWAMLGMPINGFSSGERAGWSVSISGDGSSVAVGAPKGGGSASGSVVTYRFENGSSWEPYGNVLEGVSKEAFGYTIALSYDGRLLAVGSPKSMNPEGASNTGKVSVFYMYGTEWLPLPASEIHGISENDIDGTSVALSQDGSILVVGGKGRDNDGGVSNVGHCRIYKFGTEWELLHSMEGQTENERLGSSVAVAKNGNVVACGGEGAMYDGVGIGLVRIWNRETFQSSTVWPRTSDGGALFGSALALKEDGKVLAVGAPERISMTAGSKAGAVDVYEDFII